MIAVRDLAAEPTVSSLVGGHWLPIRDGDRRALAIYRRHYSRYVYADNRVVNLFVGPGEKMVMMTADCRALWAWRKFIDDSEQTGVNNAVFHRDIGGPLASDLIREACVIGWLRWPGERFYTYIDTRKVRRKRDFGRCYRRAGWRNCGWTKGGLLIMEMRPEWSPSEQ